MQTVRAFSIAAITMAVGACGPSAPAECPAVPTATPTSTPTAVASVTPSASATGSATPYTGHGAESVPPEILAKYAPPRLDPAVSRRVQAMLDVRAPSPGVVSNDGKQLYFSWTITGFRQVWRLDGPQRFPVQLTGGEDATTIAGIAPNDAFVIVGRDRKGEEYPGLYLVDPKVGQLVEIQHKPKVQTFFQFITDDSKYIYFRANDVKPDSYALYRYEVETKKIETIFTQDGIWEISDHEGTDKLLLVKQVGSNMEEYFEYIPSTKKLTPLFGQGERENHEALYGAGGDVLVLTPKLGEFRRLYRFKDGKMTPVTPDMKADVSGFSIDHDRKRILYQVNEQGYTKAYAMDAKSFKDIKLPKLPSADHVVFGATSHNGKYTAISVDTGTAPPTSYVLEWKGNKLAQWHKPSAPEVDTSKFARASLETYPAKDGTKIPMFVRRPEGCAKPSTPAAGAAAPAKDPCPVIVMFHGGPEAQALPGWSPRAQMIVDAGFVLVEPNVRGSDGYGRAWLHADDAAKRLDVITDLEDAAKYIRTAWAENGKAPKVGVTGGSYGGYATLMAMTMFGGTYDAGVSIVGISSLYTFLQNTAPYRRILRVSEYGDPEKDKDALLKLSPTSYLDKVQAPLLVIQGATDPRVPVGEALQFKEKLDAKKVPCELHIFADEGHGAQKRENQVLMYGHMIRFFKDHLVAKK